MAKKPIPSAEYSSPLKDIYGKIDAEPIQDDRFTDSNSLLEYLKTKLNDQPDIQYTMDFANFSKGAPLADFNNVSPGNYGWLRNRFGLDVEVRVTSNVWYPQEPELVPQLTFGTRKKTLTQLQSDERKQIKSMPQISKAAKDASSKAEVALNSRLTGKVVGEVD
ncbi:phage tail protein [Pediococcus acidilactici]|uniref:phage tail protein n=1 Tax=Pediococcus acidilactici TaxID=1254 RepID=UPI001898516C|nr:phage tail protein [Pediococcus acidilactici]